MQSITHVIYDLAARPECIQPLRDEIEPIIAAEGWTKAAMAKMWKLDSFMKESQRMNGGKSIVTLLFIVWLLIITQFP